jgi:type II secretory pathway component PulJ
MQTWTHHLSDVLELQVVWNLLARQLREASERRLERQRHLVHRQLVALVEVVAAEGVCTTQQDRQYDTAPTDASSAHTRCTRRRGDSAARTADFLDF